MNFRETVWAGLAFLLLAVAAVTVSIVRPFYNWDMVAYIASAKSFEESDSRALHAFTYEEVRKSVPEETYDTLTMGNKYRVVMASDPAAFKGQLQFYQIRPAYTGLLYVFYKVGVNIVFASHLISGLAVLVALALLYRMSVVFLARPLMFAVPLVVVMSRFHETARYSTPDALAILAMVLSSFLYLNGRRKVLLALLPLFIGIRTDLILFIGPIAVITFLTEKNLRIGATISLILSVIVYFGILAHWENAGWSAVFATSFIDPLTPIAVPPTISIQDYLKAFVSGIKEIQSLRSPEFFANVIVVSYSLYLGGFSLKRVLHDTRSIPAEALLAGACGVFVATHFLGYPGWDYRFFAGSLVISAFCLLALFTRRFLGRGRTEGQVHEEMILS